MVIVVGVVWMCLGLLGLSLGQANLMLLSNSLQSGAACLDGSAPAYYFTPGTGDGVNKWFLHYKGGGFCKSMEDCYIRSQGEFGSSKNYPPTKNLGGGYFSSSPIENPLMYNWNKVQFMYCDGTFYTGDNATVANYNGKKLYFRGYRNNMAFFTHLSRNKNLTKGTDFVISGCSAGGVAAYYSIDRWRDNLPAKRKVRGMPDSGFGLDYEETPQGKILAQNFKWNFQQSNGTRNLDESCLAAHPQDPFSCAIVSVGSQYVTTPMFPLQSQYDIWQIENVLGTTDIATVNTFGAVLKTTFESSILSNPLNGCFLDSCTHHCHMWNSIRIDGTLSGTAFKNWYTSGVGTYKQLQPFPCDACCSP